MISGHGNTQAKVVIVGDGGSQSDVTQEYALTGYVESTLRDLVKANHLHLDELYRTVLIKEKTHQLDWEENISLLSEQYKEILKNELSQIQPNVVVPIGELAFQYVSGLQGITKFRGSILEGRKELIGKPFRVIPVLGPSPYIQLDEKQRIISRLDFSKVYSNQDRTDPIPEYGNCWIAKTAEAFNTFIGRNRDAGLLVFDIETHLDTPVCISFCFDGQESCAVPLLDRDLSKDNKVLLWYSVAKVLASPIPKINQNIKFDWKKLARYGFLINNVVGDTMIASSILYAEFPKNLGFLASIYTTMPYFKDEGKDLDPSMHGRERLYLYCAKDSLATHQIHTQQLVEMDETGTKKVYDNVIALLPIYKKMEEGLLIDDTQRQRLIAKYESLFEIYLLKIRHILSDKLFNPLSPKQVNKLVYDDLKYKTVVGVKKNKKTGTLKTDEETLDLLAWASTYTSTMPGAELLKAISACRKFHKILELLNLPLHPDGHFKYEYNLGGAETGRTTCSASSDYLLQFKNGKVIAKNIGHSIQNIGKHGFIVDETQYGTELRTIFVPHPGYSFVECDLSQAEARVDAVLSSDYDILPVFDNGIGIHRLTGSWVFDCQPGEIKKGTSEYHLAKTVRHAGERNMRGFRLLLMISRPLRECDAILEKFHKNQSNIREVFHREIFDVVKNQRKLVAPNGRQRVFFGKIDTDTLNEAISFLPQAIVADQLKFSLVKTLSEFPEAVPKVEAHDGFLAEVPTGREEEYAQIFKRNVETEIDFRACSLSRDYRLLIPMEAQSSLTNWKELKDLKI